MFTLMTLKIDQNLLILTKSSWKRLKNYLFAYINYINAAVFFALDNPNKRIVNQNELNQTVNEELTTYG